MNTCVAIQPLGSVCGHAFSSAWLKATVLKYIYTYASNVHADRTSNIERVRNREKLASNRPAVRFLRRDASRGSRPCSPHAVIGKKHWNQLASIQRVRSVSGDATVCNALFNIMHNHSLPYLGPLYSSLLHLLGKESCTLNVSRKKKVQTWPSVITKKKKKRQSMTTECDSSGCSCACMDVDWNSHVITHGHTNNTTTHVMSGQKKKKKCVSFNT